MWRPHHVSPRLRWVSALSLCVADPGVTRRYRQRAPLPLTAGLLRGAPGEALGNLGQSRAAISLGRPRARVDAGRSIDVFVYVLHTRMRRPVNSGRNASTPAIHYNRAHLVRDCPQQISLFPPIYLSSLLFSFPGGDHLPIYPACFFNGNFLFFFFFFFQMSELFSLDITWYVIHDCWFGSEEVPVRAKTARATTPFPRHQCWDRMPMHCGGIAASIP